MDTTSQTGIDFKLLLELVFSGPGATIFACLTVLVIFFNFKRLSGLFDNFKFSIPGGGAIEATRGTIVMEEMSASVRPSSHKAPASESEAEQETQDDGSYFLQLYDAEEAKDVEKVREIFASLKASPENFREAGLGKFVEVSELLSLLRAGDSGAEERLLNFEGGKEEKVEASKILFYYYLRRRCFRDASTRLDSLKALKWGRAYDAESDLLEVRDGVENSIQFLLNMEESIDDDELGYFYSELARKYKLNGDEERFRRFAELSLSRNPENSPLRFRLAWSYNKEEDYIKAYMNYCIIIRQDERDGTVLNNMSTILDKYELPIESVRHLRRAAEIEHPYPLGNIAIRYAEKGFVDEAERAISQIPEEHRGQTRGAEAVKIIADQKKEQEELYGKLNKNSDTLSALFNWCLEQARVGELTESALSGEWKSKGGETIIFDGGEVSFLRNDGERYCSNIAYPTWIHIDLELVTKPKPSASLLSSFEKKMSVTLFVRGNEIRLFENTIESDPRYICFQKHL
ncbi:tetratricopeptide repeat protein [Chelativorans alearense]|uniref:tetratricopeptide repeat protein n=1 Tax=Chelativorans alearense TaxID=2681495 RepID=UPI0013D84E13|nr:hypothetical protein [Chelativorans alearense]